MTLMFIATRRTCACISTIVASLLLHAQQPATSSTPIHQLPVVVDGSKSPSSIPDDLAYKHLIITLGIHNNPTAIESYRRDVLLRPLGLSDSDSAALITALTGLRDQLDGIEAGWGPNADAKLLRAQWNSAVGTAVDRTKNSLSPDGLAKLHDFIEKQVKPSIVIYGSN